MPKSDLQLLGLIGNPVSHSKSPQLFRHFFAKAGLHNWTYEVFQFDQFSEILPWIQTNQSLRGFNVTIPFKKDILSLLHSQSDEVKSVGAANTVIIERENEKIWLHGENTDCYGFEKSLEALNIPEGSKAMILGNGGAAAAVKFVLNKLNIPFQIVSRSGVEGTIHYKETDSFIQNKCNLIINTTPLGMEPDTHKFPPLNYSLINASHFCMDLIYNPQKTKFLQLAQNAGATIQNGLLMLNLQAEKSWDLFGKKLTK